MDLKSFYSDLPKSAREQFAKDCRTTPGVIQNVMYAVRPCSPELAALIDKHSNGSVRRWDLRPNDWHRIWPELIGTPDAPAEPAADADTAHPTPQGA